jgi:uncharacterized protein YndB with AHSA1/START domain
VAAVEGAQASSRRGTIAMVVVSRSIHIDAPVARVFALATDPAARSALNPGAVPIRVEAEDGGPVRVGTVWHFRLQLENRIVDYRTRVLAFEANRRIVSLSDSGVPFEVTLETVPEDGGTRLTQTERFEAPESALRTALPQTAETAVLDLAYRLALFLDLEAAQRMRARREALLAELLGAKLDRWLAAIRDHLEQS